VGQHHGARPAEKTSMTSKGAPHRVNTDLLA